MGLLSRMFGLDSPVVMHALEAEPAGPRFTVDYGNMTPSWAGLNAWDETTGPVSPVSRAQAIQVPAVKRARDLIASRIGAIPFLQLDTENVQTISTLLDQPERNRPRSATMNALAEDLLFEAVGWWRIVERDYRGYPTKIVRLVPGSVSQDPEGKVYYRRDGQPQGEAYAYVPDADLIRFDSPTDGLLTAGARAIRTYLRLAAAGDRYAASPRPSVVLTSSEDADPLNDDETRDMLDDYVDAVNRRGVVYLPAALNMAPNGYSPEDLQLTDQMTAAVVEIARTAGIDPIDLGVEVASRTYQNAQESRRAQINDTLGPYVDMIAERLSMGDVTPRGYRVLADYNGFLKADDSTRLTNYQLGLSMGLYTLEQVADRENLPAPIAPAPVSRETTEVPAVEQHDLPASRTFDSTPAVIGFDTEDTRLGFEVDVESRTIFGLAVPYGVPSSPKEGQRFVFSKGSFPLPADPSRVKLLMEHKRDRAVGHAIEFSEDETGLWAKFKVKRGPEGDAALSSAEDKVHDGLSIGLRDGGQFSKRGGMVHSVKVELAEISLTPDPAFSDARVSAVAAEADTNDGKDGANMGDEKTPDGATPSFSMEDLIAKLGETFTLVPKAPAGDGPEVIPPAAPRFDVVEESPYRFDAGTERFIEGANYDFMTDLHAYQRGDGQAADRIHEFMGEQFAVASASTASLNPNRQRPDLYVDRREYQYPLWTAVQKGSIPDATPFVLPKYGSSSGLISTMTEGVEPAPGAFTTTDQTVTPVELGGKVEITRRLWDQVGPRVSTEIFRKMIAGWYESLEASVVAVLDAATPLGTTLTTGGGAGGATASLELANFFADLQIVRGGFSFDTMAAQIDLYKRLANATTTTGEPLFPQLSPTNRNGSATSKFARLNVHGVDVFPEWALAASSTNAASSYLIDKDSVWAGASTPQRLDWNFGTTVQSSTNLPQVSMVTIGIHGYSAAAILDLAGVREIIYDPA